MTDSAQSHDPTARGLFLLGLLANRGSVVLLYAWLLHLESRGCNCYPGRTRMATLVGCDGSSLTRAEVQLEQAGVVQWGRNEKGHRETFAIAAADIPQDFRDQHDQVQQIVADLLGDSSAASLKKPSPKANPPAKSASKKASGKAKKAPKKAPKKSAKKVKKASKSGSLTVEERIQVTANAKNMGIYLLHGRKAIVPELMNNPCDTPEQRDGAAAAIKRMGLHESPSHTNWRVHATNGELNYHLWNVNQWCGWYWWRVCCSRQVQGKDLHLPRCGKLQGVMKTMVESTRPDVLANMINDLVDDYDLVCYRIGNAGKSLGLGETTIANSLVRGAIEGLPPRGTLDRDRLQREAERART